MATERTNDARAFHDFLGAKLSNGANGLALDECLSLWEYENQSPDERAETLAAIREGYEDLQAGRVRPFEEFDREFRRKHRLPPRS